MIKLSNGLEVPIIGLGTSTRNKKFTQDQFVDSVKHALNVGYRHIDTAKLYNNEHLIAKAIKESKLKREEIFLTTKLPPEDMGYEKALKSFETSCKQLHVDYVDLYLVHFPGALATKKVQPTPEQAKQLRLDTWKALVKLYNDGKCKAIGVSNYMIRHLDEIVEENLMLPMVNECEFHAYYTNKELYEKCKELGIAFMGYCPIAKGAVLTDPKLIELAQKYSKTPAQIAIKWSIQNYVITIPGSIKNERIEENYQVNDFELASEEIEELWKLNKDLKISWDPTNVV